MSTFLNIPGAIMQIQTKNKNEKRPRRQIFMRCYRARCILEESIIRRTRDNEEEYDTFFDEKNQLINEFNEMARTMSNRSCAFISSAVKDQATIGVMMTDIEADVKAYVKNFFSFIKLECVNINFEEITVETFKRMIPNGYHDNFKFDEDLLNDYELDDLFGRYRRSYINENITKTIDKTAKFWHNDM